MAGHDASGAGAPPQVGASETGISLKGRENRQLSARFALFTAAAALAASSPISAEPAKSARAAPPRVRGDAPRRGDILAAVDAELSAAAALARARELAGVSPGRGDSAELVLDAPPLGEAARAWVVDLIETRELRAERWILDAESGRVREHHVLTASARAEVWKTSPAVDRAPVAVELFSLVGDGSRLASAALEVESCIDIGRCSAVVPQARVHTCSPVAQAVGDPMTGYLDYRYGADSEPADPFAEVQAFRHLEVTAARLRALGVTAAPLKVLVNYHAPDLGSRERCAGELYTGTTPLSRFDGALFAPGGKNVGADLGDVLVFGQGRSVDWSYDLDVVAHEYGHAVIAALAPDLGRGHVDEWGWDPTPAALHEAFADFVTLSVTGDPELGEYVGSAFGDGGPLRRLDRESRCDALSGRPHPDSLPFTSALYRTRSRLGDKGAFDTAVFKALASLGAFADLPAAAAALRAALGPEARDVLDEELAAADFERCDRRLRGPRMGSLVLPGDDIAPYGDPLPAPVQQLLELSAEAGDLELTIDFVNIALPPEEIQLEAVARSGAPLRWRAVGESWESDAESRVSLEIDSQGRARGRLPGPFPPGPVYVQLVNRSPGGALSGVELRAGPAIPGGCRMGDRPPLSALLTAALALVCARRRFGGVSRLSTRRR